MIFDESHLKSFIYAFKIYEKLTVLKQFIPHYSLKHNGYLKFTEYLKQAHRKYGNNLIVNGGRYPYVGLKLLTRSILMTKKKNIITKIF